MFGLRGTSPFEVIATDVGLALSTFGTPAGESAVTSLAALIHEHPIIAPGAIDRSFAAEIEEHPGDNAAAAQILVQIGLSSEANERDRGVTSDASTQPGAGPGGVPIPSFGN